MSQGDLANAAGYKQQGIYSIENGDVERPRKIREIAAALETTENWLLWKEGPSFLHFAGHGAAPEPTITNVPLLDWVSAGRLAAPQSQIPVDDVPLLAFADLGRGDFFALTVQGDSMDLVSPEGSTIIVNKTDRTLISGKYYVFSLKGDVGYKRWQGEDPPYLEPFSTNRMHKPTFVRRKNDLEVIGRVRRTLLDL